MICAIIILSLWVGIGCVLAYCADQLGEVDEILERDDEE